MRAHPDRPTIPFAAAIPPVRVIQADLERTEAAAELLRKLLRLALERDRRAAQLGGGAAQEGGPNHAA